VKKERLISFEGLDGAGKTTQIAKLENWLKKKGIPYICTREPGGTLFGIEIRKLLLSVNNPELKINALAEAFLFQADRAQHFAEVVLPALREGKLVISDRCFDASIAYQGYARGVGEELVKKLSLLAMHDRKPDLTILLDLDPSQVHRRVGHIQQLPLPDFIKITHGKNGVREEPNRLDSEAQIFHRRVRDGFLDLARANRRRIKKVDASLSPEQIHEQIIARVELLWVDPKSKRDTAYKHRHKGKEDSRKYGQTNNLWVPEDVLLIAHLD
jgi:dTMP kinase